jgi:hypothetical protein
MDMKGNPGDASAEIIQDPKGESVEEPAPFLENALERIAVTAI